MTTQLQYYPLGGGEDLRTSPLAVKPGRALIALNYDLVPEGGYRRLGGIERFDGQPAPSEAIFYGVRFTGTVDWVRGDTVAGGTIIDVSEPDIDGIFVATFEEPGPTVVEDATYGNGSTTATAISVSIARLTADDTQFASSTSFSRELRRAVITEVPGSGPVRGIFGLGDDLFAIRDNEAGDAGAIYKATSSGWVQETLDSGLSIDTGSVEILRGEVITGQSSGATATVVAVVRESGQWGDSDWAGVLYVKDQTGTFTPTEDIETAASSPTANATFTGTYTIDVPAGGAYSSDEYNFFGNAEGNAVFVTNGVGPALALTDGIWVEIQTGTPVDTPERVRAHRGKLFLSFAGGSLQYSSSGNPYDFNAVTGDPGEIGVGREITGMISLQDVLVVFSSDYIQILYGVNDTNFEFRPFSRETGGLPFSEQQAGPIYFVDSRGITSMRAAQEFGNFMTEPISVDINPYLLQSLPLITGSLVDTKNNLYRLFFSNGQGVTMSWRENRVEGFTRFRLPFITNTNFAQKLGDGTQRLFLGSTEGMVYEMEKGTSFDGEPVTALLRLVFNNIGSPTVRKRFKKIVFDMESAANSVLRFSADLSYGSPNVAEIPSQDAPLIGGGGFWDSVNWNEFLWGSQPIPELEARIDGTGKNISLLIDGSGDNTGHTISGAIIHYIPRRLQR